MIHPQTRTVAGIPLKRIAEDLATVTVLALLIGGMSLAVGRVASGDPDRQGQLQQPDGDWPCWRGPGSAGVRIAELVATHWSESQGILWKTAVPGQGHASPIVFGDQVFISTADERTQTQSLLAYHRKTGALLWNTPVYCGKFPVKHRRNSHASPTPACDGAHVFVPSVADNALWLSAVDLSGKVTWQRRLGPFVSEWGYAPSPALYKDLVIVAGDNKGTPDAANAADTSYLVGVDRRSGEPVWRVPRPLIASYGTPVTAHVAGRDQLLISGAERIVAYNPADGREIWSFRWGAFRSANSMVWGPDCVFASTTARENQVLCVRADGTGDVTDSHLVWKQTRSVTDIPSPLYHDGRLYLTTDQGLAVCMDAATGKTLWENRLGGPISGSPVLTGEVILSIDEAGKAHVFKAGSQFQLLAANSLDERVMASPALAGDHVFVRGASSLYCLDGRTQGAPEPANPPPSPQTSRGIERPRETRAHPVKAQAPAESEDNVSWLLWVAVAILGVLTMFVSVVVVALLIAPRREGNGVPRRATTP